MYIWAFLWFRVCSCTHWQSSSDVIFNFQKTIWKSWTSLFMTQWNRTQNWCIKILLCISEVEYLGYWITQDGIQPLPKRVATIQRIAPTTRKQLWSFIGMINYYWDMWARCSELLAPLSHLTSKNVKFQWTEIEQQGYERIKNVVCWEVLLSYPDFSQPFHIDTNTSHLQLVGALISQNHHPIAFYSHKLQLAQTQYTMTEQNLLLIVETLKEFCNILLRKQIVIHTARSSKFNL
jgi:hypothetical protein